MEQIQICKGVKVDKIIKTKTWIALEEHFGVPIQQIGIAFEKLQVDMNVNQLIDFTLLIAAQDNSITREELIEKIDADTSNPLGIVGAFTNACLIWGTVKLGKSQKNQEKNLKT